MFGSLYDTCCNVFDIASWVLCLFKGRSKVQLPETIWIKYTERMYIMCLAGALPQTPLWELTALRRPLAGGEGAGCPLSKNPIHPRSWAFGPQCSTAPNFLTPSSFIFLEICLLASVNWDSLKFMTYCAKQWIHCHAVRTVGPYYVFAAAGQTVTILTTAERRLYIHLWQYYWK